ncbi:MAG: hypothetical protein ACK4RK_10750 [Gemmataceae bacterium]
MTIRNRIKQHVRIRAGDLACHELNPRVHNDVQRAALAASYRQIGFSRSLLAYELPDGRLKLIDGHLRRDMHPDMIVDVEVLDVSDEEARALLLSIDPLAQLADYDQQVLDQLRSLTATEDDTLHNLWQALRQSDQETRQRLSQTSAPFQSPNFPEQFFILIECTDEAEQVELLQRFEAEGFKCQAKSI